jgi:hypothetical protein
MRGCSKELHLVGVHARCGRILPVSYVSDMTSLRVPPRVASGAEAGLKYRGSQTS